MIRLCDVVWDAILQELKQLQDAVASGNEELCRKSAICTCKFRSGSGLKHFASTR